MQNMESALTVILRVVIGGQSGSLVLSIVNLQLQGWLSPTSSKPVLRILQDGAACVMGVVNIM